MYGEGRVVGLKQILIAYAAVLTAAYFFGKQADNWGNLWYDGSIK